MLEQYGVQVELAGEGDEGIAMIERVRPDLVLVDVRMPHCDGPSMTRMLRQNHPDWRLPVIACSATTLDGERAAAIDAGMDGWLAKPVRVGDLTAHLERHLGPPVDLP
jgi:CheY-like chemotaxis protein